jgi:hypothetical protein
MGERSSAEASEIPTQPSFDKQDIDDLQSRQCAILNIDKSNDSYSFSRRRETAGVSEPSGPKTTVTRIGAQHT